jgi:hypothetical protein
MKRIVVPTTSAADWAPLLAKPKLHWKKGKSAMSLAACWEAAHPGMPPEVTRCLDAAHERLLSGLSLVLALPEFSTPLPGGETASQTDVMVVCRNEHGLVVIGVEGKVEEEFGPTIEEKRAEASEGQSARLQYLHDQLGLTHPLAGDIRYQLLHRTVAVVQFAVEMHAAAAVMLVHSFSPRSTWFDDFAAFSRALGASPCKDAIAQVPMSTPVPLFVGWVSGNRTFTEVDVPAAI